MSSIRQISPQATTGGAGAEHLDIVMPGNTLPGNAIVIALTSWSNVGHYASGVAATHDTLTAGGHAHDSANTNTASDIFYLQNMTGGDFTYTISFISGDPTYAEAVGFEVVGMAATTPRDAAACAIFQANGDGATSTAVTGGSAPAQANNLVVGVLGVNINSVDGHIASPAATGYTALSVQQNALFTIGHQVSEKFISSNGAAQSATWTHDAESLTQGHCATIDVYKLDSPLDAASASLLRRCGLSMGLLLQL